MDFFGQKTAINLPVEVSEFFFFKQDLLHVILVTITITESQSLAVKLPKLQEQNMTIFPALY